MKGAERGTPITSHPEVERVDRLLDRLRNRRRRPGALRFCPGDGTSLLSTPPPPSGVAENRDSQSHVIAFFFFRLLMWPAPVRPTRSMPAAACPLVNIRVNRLNTPSWLCCASCNRSVRAAETKLVLQHNVTVSPRASCSNFSSLRRWNPSVEALLNCTMSILTRTPAREDGLFGSTRTILCRFPAALTSVWNENPSAGHVPKLVYQFVRERVKGA